ncbi:MAG: DNA polymerase IV [Emergencia sp.]|nr:DNA polymerase IV [Emergencia sp.]
MNNFYASVELLSRPDLKDVPVAVCGDPEGRHGIILAKNQLAKVAGVVTAETVWQAKKKCPSLQFVRPHHDKYKEYSDRINKIYLEYTDMVEPFSIDESWLDVTASQRLFGNGRQIADTIRQRIKSELGLTLSVGVSYNKVFAKMGSEYRKPDATTEVTRQNYPTLLFGKPVGELFFVGFATAEKLKTIHIRTIGDLAAADPRALERLLGKQGPLLHSYANGLDDSPVCLYNQREKIKSVGNGITFARNLTGIEDITTALTSLSDTVASRLRKYQMKCFGVKVDIKNPAFKTISRQKQLPQPTNLAADLKKAALELLGSSWRLSDPIRLLTLTAINLTDETAEEQLSLFDAPAETRQKGESIERTMDDIRKKFGDSSITFGQILDNDIGIDL